MLPHTEAHSISDLENFSVLKALSLDLKTFLESLNLKVFSDKCRFHCGWMAGQSIFLGGLPQAALSPFSPAGLLAAFHHLPCLIHLDRFVYRLALLVKYS